MAQGQARKTTTKNNDVRKIIGEISNSFQRGEGQDLDAIGQLATVEEDHGATGESR